MCHLQLIHSSSLITVTPSLHAHSMRTRTHFITIQAKEQELPQLELQLSKLILPALNAYPGRREGPAKLINVLPLARKANISQRTLQTAVFVAV